MDGRTVEPKMVIVDQPVMSAAYDNFAERYFEPEHRVGRGWALWAYMGLNARSSDFNSIVASLWDGGNSMSAWSVRSDIADKINMMAGPYAQTFFRIREIHEPNVKTWLQGID